MINCGIFICAFLKVNGQNMPRLFVIEQYEGGLHIVNAYLRGLYYG